MLIAFASAFTFPTQASPVRRVLQFIFVNALTSRTPLKYYCAMTCWYLQPPPLSVVFASSLVLLLLKILKHLSVLTFLFYSSFVNCYIFRNKWYNAFQPIGQFPGQDNWKIHPNIDNKNCQFWTVFVVTSSALPGSLAPRDPEGGQVWEHYPVLYSSRKSTGGGW